MAERTRSGTVLGAVEHRGRTLHGHWHALPLRVRLVVLITSLLLAGLGTAGLATVTLLRPYLVRTVDDRLTSSAVELANSALGSFVRPQDEPQLPSDYYVRYAPFTGETSIYVHEGVTTSSGVPLVPSATMEEVFAQAGRPFSVASTRSQGSWRVVMYPVRSGQDVIGTVAVALPLDEVDETMAQITRLLMVSGLGIVVLGAVTASLGVRRALQPLRAVEATAQAFAAGDFTQRVPAEPASTEVGRLARSLNGMLAQIERAFAARAASEARIRRFVADASHELRTPLSTVRGYGELYRMGAIAPQDVGPAMERIESEAVRMGALVADLLQLAKLDEGRPLANEPVDLHRLATDGAADLRALDPTRTVAVVGLDEQPPGGPAPFARGDEARLRQVVANLIGNVALHTPAGTPVEIAVGRRSEPGLLPAPVDGSEVREEAVVLEVRDHGPGIPPDDAERVFERFFRVDTSRSRASGGTGLGLAIVAAVTAAHHGSVRVVGTPGGGTTVRLALPAAPAPTDDDAG